MAVAVAEAVEASLVPPTTQAVVVGGAFPDLDRMTAVMRALRAARATEDIIGFAIPLEGDPTTPEGLVALARPRQRRRFDPLRFLMLVIDPHAPAPDLATLQRGHNSILAQPLLGDLATWLVGVKPFRVPGEREVDPGVWVLGRINHAATLAGMSGAAEGGMVGALASIGIPSALAAGFAARLRNGECLMTTCETDPGRVQRDLKLFRRHGAQAIFDQPVLSPPRKQA